MEEQLTFFTNKLFPILGPVIAGILCFYWFSKKNDRSARLKKNGITTEGIVFDITTRAASGFFVNVSTNRDWDDSIRSAYPIIRFTTEKQEWVTKEYLFLPPFFTWAIK